MVVFEKMGKEYKRRRRLSLVALLSSLAPSILLVLALAFASISSAFAAGATLYLYPSSGTRYADTYLSVYVLVNTGGEATNAYKAVVTYPSDKLWITAVSSGGSICSLWIPPSPSYANNQGVATFECGAPSVYSGSNGRIGVITFLVRGMGTATVSIAEGSVKKADGQGTEILTGRGSATFALKPSPTANPEVSSSTHPDQNAWYQAKTAELSWTASEGVTGFSYFLSQEPEGTPDDVSEGAETDKALEDLADGTWYFHLKAYGTSGWSGTTHFRIQVDTQSPEDFEIVSDPPADEIIGRAPMLSFAATDGLSGIDYYELSVDGSDFARAESPYQFERIKTGERETTVKAVDKAGNTREAKITLKLRTVASPVVSQPTEGTHHPLFKPLITRGTTAEAGAVEIYLDGQLLTTLELAEASDFEYAYEEFLHPWEHKVSVILVTEEGIESLPTEINFEVDPKAITLFGLVTLPGWLVYALLIGAILLLLILLVRYLIKMRRFRKEVDDEVKKVEKGLEKELDEMKKDLEQAVEETLQGGDDRRLRGMERYLRKRIEEEDAEMQRDLREKLKRIKEHPVRRSLRRRVSEWLRKIKPRKSR